MPPLCSQIIVRLYLLLVCRGGILGRGVRHLVCVYDYFFLVVVAGLAAGWLIRGRVLLVLVNLHLDFLHGLFAIEAETNIDQPL